LAKVLACGDLEAAPVVVAAAVVAAVILFSLKKIQKH
jgi:hypothetical protein